MEDVPLAARGGRDITDPAGLASQSSSSRTSRAEARHILQAAGVTVTPPTTWRISAGPGLAIHAPSRVAQIDSF